ncbi:hypothetical protein J1605_022745 [Eschrichtius robustus]|uniref:Vesicle-associated membrane protein 7 n=1 Tax=Eschrichtius robustus TaxID=9764 RepID=A0AB34HAN0_ESCRO|nr:hypothetical protein J1605_022745 [Eschrichtius robustus]
MSRAVRSGGNLYFTSSPTMTITYSCIANGRAVLAELALTGGSYQMKYNKNQEDSLISALKSQVTDVKNVMTQSIDKILEREERLNIFTDRTDDLQTTVSVTQLS